MTDEELQDNVDTFMAILAEKKPTEVLVIAVELQIQYDALCKAIRRERKAYINHLDDSGSAKKEDDFLSAHAEVLHLVDGGKD